MRTGSYSKKRNLAVVIHYPHIHEMLGIVESYSNGVELLVEWLATMIDEMLLIPYARYESSVYKIHPIEKQLAHFLSDVYQLSRVSLPIDGDMVIQRILLRKDGSTVIFIQ